MADASPGPVQDSETLHLLISDPADIQDEKLSARSFIRIDRSGVSVLREGAQDSEFELTITELKANSAARNMPRTFLGVCKFSARTIRYCQDSWPDEDQDAGSALPHCKDSWRGKGQNAGSSLPPQRLVGVYDTALPGKRHHADMIAPPIKPATDSKSELERARRRRIKKLIAVTGRCFDPARSFRGGLLAKKF